MTPLVRRRNLNLYARRSYLHSTKSMHVHLHVRRKPKEANIAGNIRKIASASHSLTTPSRATHIKRLNVLEDNAPTPSSQQSSLLQDYVQQYLLQRRATLHIKLHNYIAGLLLPKPIAVRCISLLVLWSVSVFALCPFMDLLCSHSCCADARVHCDCSPCCWCQVNLCLFLC